MRLGLGVYIYIHRNHTEAPKARRLPPAATTRVYSSTKLSALPPSARLLFNGIFNFRDDSFASHALSIMSDAVSSAVSSVIGFLEEDSNDSSVQQDAAITDISADLEMLRDDPRILKALRTGQDLSRYSRKVRLITFVISRLSQMRRWTKSCGRSSVTASRII